MRTKEIRATFEKEIKMIDKEYFESLWCAGGDKRNG